MDRFDFAIIGGGPAGEAATYEARARGASVAVIDRDLFGGSCPFWGCIPSKSLLHAADRHAAGGDYPWSKASRSTRLHDQPRGHRLPERCRPRQGARGRRRDGHPRHGVARGTRARHDPPRRRHPRDRGQRTSSSASAPSRRSRPSTASRRSGPGRTRTRPRRASCRAACSSSAADRPASSSPRSSRATACRRRSSSRARGSSRATIRATPKRPSSHWSATASRSGSDVAGRQGDGWRRVGRRRCPDPRRRVDRGRPRDAAVGRSHVPARGPRPRDDRARPVDPRRRTE